MDPFSSSPLFRESARMLQDAALDAFRSSSLGRMVSELKSAVASPGRPSPLIAKAAKAFASGGPKEAIRQLIGMDIADLARGLERYSKKDSETAKLLGKLLDSMGPAGKVLKSITSGNGKEGNMEALIDLLRAAGYEPLSPKRLRNPQTVKRELGAALKFLEDLGLKVKVPEEFSIGQDKATFTTKGHAEQAPTAFRTPRPGEAPEDTDTRIPMENGGFRNFPPDHPIVTGAMVPCPESSNVHSYGYDASAAYLYVRFYGNTPEEKKAKRPGPVYRYSSVTPNEFLSLMGTSSKGDWVWDELRIRGTLSGHRKDYELVGVVEGYVPRKATMMAGGEGWIKRKIRTTSGQWLRSEAPAQLVRPLAEINRGTPNRGTPNRGTPRRK